MNISELFKDAFDYSTSGFDKIIILGLLIFGIVALSIITGISAIFNPFASITILGGITLILVFVISLIYSGYGLSVIRDTILNKNISIDGEKISLPEFRWSLNIKDGLKVLILFIVYMIIPLIISIVIGIFSGVMFFDPHWSIYNPHIGQYHYYVSSVSMNSFGFFLSLANIANLILFIIFSLFAIIAMGRLAETNSLSSIFEFKEMFNRISKIGWGNYIIWFILLHVITIIIAFISAIVIFIPIIGLIAYLLIIPPFLLVFQSRAIGLIYNESKDSDI